MLKLKTPKKWLALILILLADAVAAHEFWLEPLSYHINPGDRVKVHIKVGQHFSGNTQPYLPDKSEKFNLELSGRPVDVTPRIGDIPALNLPLEDRGLALLSYVSTDYILEYRDPGRFEAFLEYDGLSEMLTEHKRRGLPMTGFSEAYQRFAKSLVQVGTGGGADRLLGLEFEWVLEQNPYTNSERPLSARLYWRGEPLTGVQARLFVRQGSRVEEQVFVTDIQGRVMLTPPRSSQLLLNAVQLRKPSARAQAQTGVAWKSFWASTTFAIPD